MTKEQREAIKQVASGIEYRERVLRDIDRAFSWSGDSVSGHIPLTKRLAGVHPNVHEH